MAKTKKKMVELTEELIRDIVADLLVTAHIEMKDSKDGGIASIHFDVESVIKTYVNGESNSKIPTKFFKATGGKP